jgi:uncharacterized cupredoxin-like copper-binding protein
VKITTSLSAALLMAATLASSAAWAHSTEEHAAKRQDNTRKAEPTAFGQEGDPAKVSRTVKVAMSDDMRFTPAAITVKRGETIQFLVRNNGQVLHEMVLGTKEAIAEHAALMKKFPGMEHDDANMTHVKPGKEGTIVWQFSRAGEFRFACLLPGHFEAGMVGEVAVE